LPSRRGLAGERKRLRLAIDVAALGEADVDYETGTVVTSSRFREIFGISGSGPKTVDELRAFYHPDDRGRVSRQIDAALADGQMRLGLEFRVVRPDGTVTWVELLGGKGYRSAVEGRRAVAVVRDITAATAEEHCAKRGTVPAFCRDLTEVVWIATLRPCVRVPESRF
jgi:PAS domain S-box-containing protein